MESRLITQKHNSPPNKIGAANSAPRWQFYGFGFSIHLVAGVATLTGLGLLLRKTLAGWLRPFFTCARAYSNARLPFRAAGSSCCGSALIRRFHTSLTVFLQMSDNPIPNAVKAQT
jgi:hypothetical protein